MAAPVVDSAPSWRENAPTCRAITAPNGIEMSTTGTLVTFAMNQHWRRYSFHQLPHVGDPADPLERDGEEVPGLPQDELDLADHRAEPVTP